nr:hypothetical protein CFP56_22270 [Quercus suber]
MIHFCRTSGIAQILRDELQQRLNVVKQKLLVVKLPVTAGILLTISNTSAWCGVKSVDHIARKQEVKLAYSTYNQPGSWSFDIQSKSFDSWDRLDIMGFASTKQIQQAENSTPFHLSRCILAIPTRPKNFPTDADQQRLSSVCLEVALNRVTPRAYSGSLRLIASLVSHARPARQQPHLLGQHAQRRVLEMIGGQSQSGAAMVVRN